MTASTAMAQQTARVVDAKSSLFWDLSYSGAGTLQTGNYLLGEAWCAIPSGGSLTVTAVGRYLPGTTTVDTTYTGPRTFPNLADPSVTEYRDGTMKNPRGGGTLVPDPGGNDILTRSRTGYDSRNTQAAWRESMFNASAFQSFPLALAPGDVIVSTISNPEVGTTGNPGYPWASLDTSISASAVRRAAVLTCLAYAPSTESFRLPYAMPTPALRASLTHLTAADIDWSRLPRVAPHPNAVNHPAPADLAPFFDKVWLEHISGETCQYQMCPTDHQPGYGERQRNAISSAALLAAINPDPPPHGPSSAVPLNADFRGMIYGMLQVGIDTWGLMQDETHSFEGGGGLVGGRKFLVAFAGKMFGSNAYAGPVYGMNGPWTMQRLVGGIPVLLPRFKEDQQFFEASSSALALPASRGDWDWQGSPWKWGAGLNDRNYQHLEPQYWTYDDAHFSEQYRVCCSAPAFVGMALAARILDMESVFSNRAFFGGIDRYMILEHPSSAAQLSGAGVGPSLSTSTYQAAPVDYNPHNLYQTPPTFTKDMWDAYRWQSNQGKVRIVPDGFSFSDEADRGVGAPPPCPVARVPVMATQMSVQAGGIGSITDILVEVYASDSYWLPPLLMVAGDCYPSGFSVQSILGSPNDVVTYVDLLDVVWLGSSANAYGYFAEVVPVPAGIVGEKLAMQALFVGMTGCYVLTNALVVEVE